MFGTVKSTIKQFQLKDIPANVFEYKPKLDVCDNCNEFKRLYCIIVNIFSEINPELQFTQINNSIIIHEKNSESKIEITE